MTGARGTAVAVKAAPSTAEKIVIGGMGALLLLGAVVQFNDPDPYLWAAIYIAAAAVSFGALRAPESWRPAAAVAAVAGIWAVTLAPAAARTSFPALFEAWEMMNSEVEEGRELGGLILIAAWTSYLTYRGYRRSHAPDGREDD